MGKLKIQGNVQKRKPKSRTFGILGRKAESVGIGDILVLKLVVGIMGVFYFHAS